MRNILHNTKSVELDKQKKRIFYGWWIVLASILLHFLGGGAFFYGFSVFFNPIRNEFGWSAAVTSVAFTLRGIEQGALGPVAGMLVDKLGPRKLMVSGWVIIGLGFLLMSRVNSLAGFYAAFLVTATGMSFGTGLVMNTVVANWFNKKRSRALALTFIGPGLSGLMAPILALGIGNFGWKTTLAVMGVLLFLFGVPLSLLFRHKPGQYGYLPDGEEPVPDGIGNGASGTKAKRVDSTVSGFTAKEALKTRAFWLLALTFLFQQVGTSAVTVHIVPYLESVDVPTSIAAVAVTGMTLCSLIGRLGFGFLGDFANKRYLIAIALAVQTVGLVIFSFISKDNVWLLVPFLLTYSPGFGGPIPLRPALQADYFGTKSFGAILGLVSLIGTLGGLASPVVAGWVFDTQGSYHYAWLAFALFSAPSIPMILLAGAPKKSAQTLD